ncbi:MAG: hypothetical protein R2851_18540 [Caldilineaceae bacterium]
MTPPVLTDLPLDLYCFQGNRPAEAKTLIALGHVAHYYELTPPWLRTSQAGDLTGRRGIGRRGTQSVELGMRGASRVTTQNPKVSSIKHSKITSD